MQSRRLLVKVADLRRQNGHVVFVLFFLSVQILLIQCLPVANVKRSLPRPWKSSFFVFSLPASVQKFDTSSIILEQYTNGGKVNLPCPIGRTNSAGQLTYSGSLLPASGDVNFTISWPKKANCFYPFDTKITGIYLNLRELDLQAGELLTISTQTAFEDPTTKQFTHHSNFVSDTADGIRSYGQFATSNPTVQIRLTSTTPTTETPTTTITTTTTAGTTTTIPIPNRPLKIIFRFDYLLLYTHLASLDQNELGDVCPCHSLSAFIPTNLLCQSDLIICPDRFTADTNDTEPSLPANFHCSLLGVPQHAGCRPAHFSSPSLILPPNTTPSSHFFDWESDENGLGTTLIYVAIVLAVFATVSLCLFALHCATLRNKPRDGRLPANGQLFSPDGSQVNAGWTEEEHGGEPPPPYRPPGAPPSYGESEEDMIDRVFRAITASQQLQSSSRDDAVLSPEQIGENLQQDEESVGSSGEFEELSRRDGGTVISVDQLPNDGFVTVDLDRPAGLSGLCEIDEEKPPIL